MFLIRLISLCDTKRKPFYRIESNQSGFIADGREARTAISRNRNFSHCWQLAFGFRLGFLCLFGSMFYACINTQIIII